MEREFNHVYRLEIFLGPRERQTEKEQGKGDGTSACTGRLCEWIDIGVVNGKACGLFDEQMRVTGGPIPPPSK